MTNSADFTGERIYDLSILEQMDDNKFVSEILRLYLRDSPKDLNEMKSALSSSLFDVVQKKAHKLKGSTAMLRAEKLYIILERIEVAAKTGNKKDELNELAESAQNEFNRLESALQIHI